MSRAEYLRQWRESHPGYFAGYYAANKKSYRKAQRKYYAAHREEILASKRRLYHEAKEDAE